MSNSALATKYMPAHANNYYGQRTAPISEIIIHHMAAKWTAERCAQSFQSATRGASATYCIGYNGEIVRCLDESIAPGTSSSKTADNRAVTIEVANSSMGGNWPVSDASLNSLIKLVADIAKRNNLGTLVKGKNVTWHQMYAATACPGPYLLSKMDYIVSKANAINAPALKTVSDGKVAPTANLNGTNISRATNYLVRYTKANTKTNTNKWGVEVRVDSMGQVIDTPKYGDCNKTVPAGGYVLSGHGTMSSWLLSNVKKGYSVAVSGNKITVIPTGGGFVNGTNTNRPAEWLVLYKSPKTTTGTNNWGVEIACDKNGKVVNRWGTGSGNHSIPSGGFILSGHNTSGNWLWNNIKIGDTISISNHKIVIKR